LRDEGRVRSENCVVRHEEAALQREGVGVADAGADPLATLTMAILRMKIAIALN